MRARMLNRLPTIGILSIWMVCAGIVSDDSSSADELPSYSEQIPGSDLQIPMIGIAGGQAVVRTYLPMERSLEEEDRRTVMISPFWIGKYELRYTEYWQWIRHEGGGPNADRAKRTFESNVGPTAGGRNGRSKRGDHPAVGMNHWAAKRYCHWLSMLTARFYRLPTEAEWEYACRAGNDESVYPWGDDFAEADRFAVRFTGPDSNHRLAVVGTKEPNAWGIHDMIGNVEEWVADGYDPLRRMTHLSDPMIWPVTDKLSADATPVRVRMRELREDFCDGWGVAKGGSHSSRRCQQPRCFSISARTNPHLISNHLSPLPEHLQDAKDNLDSILADCVGFRIARPETVPDRERQLWHWGIYFNHEQWIDLTITPSR